MGEYVASLNPLQHPPRHGERTLKGDLRSSRQDPGVGVTASSSTATLGPSQPHPCLAKFAMLSPMSSLTTASSSSLSLSLLAISSLFLQLPISTHAHSSSPSCKAVPGTHDWPSEHSWKRLNESTGGRLLRPPPPGAVCHPGQPTYDAAKCPAVQSGWGTYQFHSDDPISSMWNQYNNDSCIPDPSDPCSGEGYPLFVINATTAEHVKLGVDFGEYYYPRGATPFFFSPVEGEKHTWLN